MYLLKICFSDINECLDKQRTAMCPQHSDCLNTDGSYKCNCKNGYQDTNGTCTGILNYFSICIQKQRLKINYEYTIKVQTFDS